MDSVYFYTVILISILVGSIGLATIVHLGQKRAERRSAGVQRLRGRFDHLNEIIDRLQPFPIGPEVLQTLADARRRVANQLEAEHDTPVGPLADLVPAAAGASFRHDDELGLRKSVAACRKSQRVLQRIAREGAISPDSYQALVREIGRCEVRMQVETLEHLGERDAETDRLAALRYLRQAAELLMKNAHLDKSFARTLHHLRSRIATIQSGLAADNIADPDGGQDAAPETALTLKTAER